MSFVTSLAKGINWVDKTLGTGGAIARTVLPAVGSAQSFYYKNIAGSFVEDVGKELVGGFVSKGDSPGYSVPTPEASSPNFRSSVRPGEFTASQARSMGLENPRVREAYSKVSQSNNPSIRAALNIVRPTIGSRGPTKSLREAEIGD